MIMVGENVTANCSLDIELPGWVKEACPGGRWEWGESGTPERNESPPPLPQPRSPNASAALCPGLGMEQVAQAVLLACLASLWPFGVLMDSTCLEDSKIRRVGLLFHLFAVDPFILLLSGPVSHLAVFCTRSSTCFRTFCKRVSE